MRRLRVTFTKGEEVRYISHLDLMRTWERILRRGGIRLAHSQGFNPRPRLVFAAPLPVGVTSDCEILDVFIEDQMSSGEFLACVQGALPPGITLSEVTEQDSASPPIMASVWSSDYLVDLDAQGDVAPRLADFLARDHVLYERVRKGAVKQGDMRPAVLDLWLDRESPKTCIGLRLLHNLEGQAVRPQEVVAALDPEWRINSVHRAALRLKDESSRAHAA